MADLNHDAKEGVEQLVSPDQDAQETAERLAEPTPSSQGKIPGKDEAAAQGAKKEEPPLPKLSAADFRVYNHMAETMGYYHQHFRQTWTLLYNACTANARPRNLSLAQFLGTGMSFCRQLQMHHGIEETHIFPVLARKMPEFKNGKDKAELLRQHKEIHNGMDGMEEYLQKCKDGEESFELRVLKEKMDGWGDVLWKHLDQEVETLGAENMRRYWTLEEMRRMPM